MFRAWSLPLFLAFECALFAALSMWMTTFRGVPKAQCDGFAILAVLLLFAACVFMFNIPAWPD